VKVALDTNVLVSGLLKPYSSAGTIVRLVAEGKIQVVYDARILTEYNFNFNQLNFNYVSYPPGCDWDIGAHENNSIDCTPSVTLLTPEINGKTLTQNGVAYPTCCEWDLNWCSENTCGADPDNGPFQFLWGDGAGSCSWFPCSHTYASSGTYTITVKAKNKFGNIGEDSHWCMICHCLNGNDKSGHIVERTIQVTIP